MELKADDFLLLAKSLSLSQKQVVNIFKRFHKAIPAVFDFIDESFLPEDKKMEYRELIGSMVKRF